jgi:hypothetical protein
VGRPLPGFVEVITLPEPSTATHSDADGQDKPAKPPGENRDWLKLLST